MFQVAFWDFTRALQRAMSEVQIIVIHAICIDLENCLHV